MTYMPDLTVAAERKTIGNYSFAVDTGAQGAYTIFTVTGDIAISVFGICKASVTSGGTPTIELGVSGNTAALIAQITNATALITNEIWHDATPTTTVESIIAATNTAFVVSNGQDIILTIGGADLTAGNIDFYALWKPLSLDANLVAA